MCSQFLCEPLWSPIHEEISRELELAMKSLNCTITKSEEMKLAERIKADPHLIKDWDFTPENINNLIRNNHELSVAVFIALNSDPIISQYYKEFTKLKLNKRVKKFVFALRKSVEIPHIFMQQFIANQIDNCFSSTENVFFLFRNNLIEYIRTKITL